MEIKHHPINSRIKAIYLHFNYKDQKDFATDLNIDERIISNVLTQKTKASTTLLQSISQKFRNINLQWLLNGIGEMLDNELQNMDNQNLFRDPSENYERGEAAHYQPPPAAVTDDAVQKKEIELLMIEVRRLNMKVEKMEGDIEGLKKRKN